jgi:phosphoribosylformylglycinamidine synthase
MIHFFAGQGSTVFAVQSSKIFTTEDTQKLLWLFNSPDSHIYTQLNNTSAQLTANFVGPRAAMITPWSTNAVDCGNYQN